MNMPDLAKAIVGELKQFVLDALKGPVAALNNRLDEVEKREPLKGERGEQGPAGEKGADAPAPTPEEMAAAWTTHVDEQAKRAFLIPLVEEVVKENMPEPVKGDEGPAGVDGKTPSETEIKALFLKAMQDDPAWVKSVIAGTVVEYFKANPVSDGKDGSDGADGKDAVALEILPAIDPEKSVPRGTYALHDGGLWRSFEKTKGMHGWEVVLDGIASVDINRGEMKTFEVVVRKSSGAEVKKDFTLPVMVYRGVYAEGTEYTKGDTVTWGGSLWHCNEDTQESPATSKLWTLAAKKGRDGRDVGKGA